MSKESPRGKEGERAPAEAKEKKKMKKGQKVLLTVLLSLAGMLLLAYFGGVLFFAFHFGFGTRINGEDCTGKSVSYVEGIIEKQVQSYVLTLKERGNKTETIAGEDVSLTYEKDGQVKKLLQKQNEWIWPYRFFVRNTIKENETHASVSLNEEALDTVIAALSCMDAESMVAPQDAYPELSGSTYVIHPEEEGTTINQEVFPEKVEEALLSTAETLDLEEAGCYENPQYTSDSGELKTIVEKYNQYLSLTVTYRFQDDTTEVLDGATTNAWFTWDENYNATVNQDALAAWVSEFAARHTTVGSTRTFTTATGGTAEVSGGTYGWKVDQTQEIANINQMFTDMQSQDREPAWSQTGASYGASDFGNTFVEVNLSSQHMWYVQDGSILFESDVVTGLPTSERATPSGVYSILEKMQNKTLRGDRREDGSYEYETPVAYWMRVTWSGVGFHDATWQSSFGGNRYTYAGSHGCINMPYSAAANLYSLISVGVPVVMHY